MQFATYCRLNVHVLASDIDVIRAARKKIKKSARKGREHRALRHAFYNEMLAVHHREGRMFRKYRF